MDGFDDNFDQGEIDPAAEFLAREQDQLAGLDDDLVPPASEPKPVTDGFLLDDDVGYGSSNPQMFGLDNALSDPPHGDYDFIAQETSPIEEELPPENGESTELNAPTFEPSPAVTPPIREEPEKIRIWREQQAKLLEEKDAREEVEKEKWRDQARQELEEWYRNHAEQVAKTKAANRSTEKEFVLESTEMEPGTEWIRISKLCTLTSKPSKSSTKDVSRMRSIILQLKQSPPVKRD